MLALTSQERRVLLFVSFVLALGLGLRFFAKGRGSDTCFFDVSSKKTCRALDINAATRDELIGLPGIGPKAADDILAARAWRGGFKNIEELKEIKGISDKKIGLLREYLYIVSDDSNSLALVSDRVTARSDSDEAVF
ncbi:MAG TPA: hypothetical protein DCL35_01835 [Candidatus Omnitrophica bacterium]|nr:hypothetical protein [Candidatus Omnitrophota bacterium]